MLPYAVKVRCSTPDCGGRGVEQHLQLRMVTPGFLEVPVLVCQHCGQPPEFLWPKEHNMPKITAHGGPSHEAAADFEGEPGPELVSFPPEEEQWPGSNSPTSSEKPSSGSDSSAPSDPQPAPTTESPSKKAQTASRSARSTAGDRTARSSATKGAAK